MKWKSLFLIGMGGCLFASCTDEVPTEMCTPALRSVTATMSPMYDWEDNSNIKLEGIPTPVTLPWYTGASTNIPDEVLKSYTAKDGWKMLYNFCSPSDYAEVGKYYLVFYNIFTGVLRTFYYNPYDVTDASTTFWHFHSNRGANLFSGWGQLTLTNIQLDSIPTSRLLLEPADLIVSNLSQSPVKSLSRGWNLFDVDMSVYDPSLADGGPLYFSIYTHELKEFNEKLRGSLSLESSGTIMQQMPQSNNSVSKAVNMVTAVGNTALDYIAAKKNEGTNKQPSDSRGVSWIDLTKEGLSLLKKLFVRETSVPLNFDINVTTNGSFDAESTTITEQQSNIAPISRLLIPGTPANAETTFLPSYEDALGVWNLKKAPVIRFVAFSVEQPGTKQEGLPSPGGGETTINPDRPIVGVEPIDPGNTGINPPGIVDPSLGTPNYGRMPRKYQVQIAVMDTISTDDLDINPAVVQSLDSIKVEAFPVEKCPLEFVPRNSAKNYSYYSITYTDNRYVVCSDTTSTYVEWKGYSAFTNHTECNNSFYIPEYKFKYTAFTMLHDVEVRVVVTLYPKASEFNSAPIKMVRTYTPVFIGDKTLAKGVDPAQGALIPGLSN